MVLNIKPFSLAFQLKQKPLHRTANMFQKRLLAALISPLCRTEKTFQARLILALPYLDRNHHTSLEVELDLDRTHVVCRVVSLTINHWFVNIHLAAIFFEHNRLLGIHGLVLVERQHGSILSVLCASHVDDVFLTFNGSNEGDSMFADVFEPLAFVVAHNSTAGRIHVDLGFHGSRLDVWNKNSA